LGPVTRGEGLHVLVAAAQHEQRLAAHAACVGVRVGPGLGLGFGFGFGLGLG